MLARTYLYTGNWSDAIAEATGVINEPQFSLNSDISQVFLANSTEAIWQLQSTVTNLNTPDAYAFILTTTPNLGNPVYLSSHLLNAFEDADTRQALWVGSLSDSLNTYYFPYKYRVQTASTIIENLMVLRLSEQFLIRAEAEANNNAPTDAVNDLNIIRNRAGLSNYAGNTDGVSLVNAILHERQVELFTEWGHRWLDLKRTQKINDVMNAVAPSKGSEWDAEVAIISYPGF